jgi:hypothetical protein
MSAEFETMIATILDEAKTQTGLGYTKQTVCLQISGAVIFAIFILLIVITAN